MGRVWTVTSLCWGVYVSLYRADTGDRFRRPSNNQGLKTDVWKEAGATTMVKGHGNDKMTWIFLPLTKRFGNARLESQKYTTFPVVLF